MLKTKILLFGATGMAGHVIYYYLQNTNKYDITNVTFRHKLTEDSIILDVTDRQSVEKIIKQTAPKIIINCVGVLIKSSKEHPDNAILLNAYFPHLLKKLADGTNAKLIHISTDCVFSGKKGNYTEEDFPDADDIYGKSKALGEIINPKDLTIRTSIIGPELKEYGEGLFHWFMHQSGEINGFKDAIWGGVTTLELSKAIDKVINSDLGGLVHLSNGTGISKYELLCLFKDIWQKNNITIHPFRGNPTNKSITESSRFNFQVPDYQTMLNEQKIWMQTFKSLYKYYE